MAVENINIALKRVSADRHWPPDRSHSGKMDINTSIDIHSTSKKSDTLAITDFTVTYSYSPGIGQIRISGKVLIKADARFISKVEKSEGEPYSQILNTISKFSTVQAVKLSEQVKIPPPVPVPNLGGDGEKLETGREYG